jgi:Ca2+-transporting ATPase
VLVGSALGLVAVVIGVGWLLGQPLLNLLEVSLSMAVAIVPEGLPAVITVTLAIGTQRMVRRAALIRRLPAVEALGSVTVICSDKTGTLTLNRQVVEELRCGSQAIAVSGQGYGPEGEFSPMELDALAPFPPASPQAPRPCSCRPGCSAAMPNSNGNPMAAMESSAIPPKGPWW